MKQMTPHTRPAQRVMIQDEVLTITKGACTVRTENEAATAQVGEVIYLWAGTPGTFQASEDAESVYVAPSPCGEVNRDATAALLNRKYS